MWECWPLFYFLSNHQCVDNQLKLGNMGCLHLGDIFFKAIYFGTIISMVWLNELRYLLLKMVNIPKPSPRYCFPTLQSSVWNKSLGMDLWVSHKSQFMLFFNRQCKSNQQPMIVEITTITFALPHQTRVGLENTTVQGSWCRCNIHKRIDALQKRTWWSDLQRRHVFGDPLQWDQLIWSFIWSEIIIGRIIFISSMIWSDNFGLW